MENVNVRKLPIAGRIQHGKQIVVGTSKKVKELGYFITNITNDIMDYLGNRFSERYPKDTKIKIIIVDENPFVVRQVRYNQGGTACYCMKGETQARQKVSNKLQRTCIAKLPFKSLQQNVTAFKNFSSLQSELSFEK